MWWWQYCWREFRSNREDAGWWMAGKRKIAISDKSRFRIWKVCCEAYRFHAGYGWPTSDHYVVIWVLPGWKIKLYAVNLLLLRKVQRNSIDDNSQAAEIWSDAWMLISFPGKIWLLSIPVEFNNQRSKLVLLGIKIGNRHIQHFSYSADSILVWLMIEAKEIWLSRYFFG